MYQFFNLLPIPEILGLLLLDGVPYSLCLGGLVFGYKGDYLGVLSPYFCDWMQLLVGTDSKRCVTLAERSVRAF